MFATLAILSGCQSHDRNASHSPAELSEFDRHQPATELAEGPLSPLAGLIGTWSIDAEWAWGQTLEARNTFEVGLGGRFIEQTTLVSDDGGPVYARYRTVYAADPATGELMAYGFTHDGSTTVIPVRLDVAGQLGAELTAVHTAWSSGDAQIRQSLWLVDADRCRWMAELQSEPDAEWTTIMDAEYHRVVPGG